MGTIDRRTLLARGALVAGAAVLAPSALVRRAGATAPGYGPLSPAANGLISLPAGFTCRVVDRTGDPFPGLPGGQPAAPDGQAFFPHPSNRRLWRTLRNHELASGPALGDPSKAYDDGVDGSVAIYDIDPTTMRTVGKQLVASGLLWPCSGGATPRRTWLACEEGTGFTGTNALAKKHGYVFEIPSTATGQITPVPLKAMGRFVHEAAVTDPKTGIVYMTEDDTPAGFYRFVPVNKDRLALGGKLQMLAIAGAPGYDTRKHQRVGVDLRATWVTIPDPDPDLEGGGPARRVAKQGIGRGAAVFDYLEGEDFRGGAVTFASAYGGDNNHGQVWRFTPSTGRLRLLYEPKNRLVVDTPDNVAVSPRGGVLICEDGYPRNSLRGLNPDGQVFEFAENLLDGGGSEFSGPVYTPDGTTLLVSIQRPGIMLAITGPWGTGQL
jgi:secreted PhoX family phosphatase